MKIGKISMLCCIDDETPYWRTLKANGELNEKYPGGAIQKGRKNMKYYVKDYENVLFELD